MTVAVRPGKENIPFSYDGVSKVLRVQIDMLLTGGFEVMFHCSTRVSLVAFGDLRRAWSETSFMYHDAFVVLHFVVTYLPWDNDSVIRTVHPSAHVRCRTTGSLEGKGYKHYDGSAETHSGYERTHGANS